MLETASLAREPDGFMALVTTTPATHAQTNWPGEARNFWPTFNWAGNPWIVNADQQPLHERQYTRLLQCNLAGIQLEWVGVGYWRFSPRLNGGRWTKKRHERLRQWIVSIMICSPSLEVGERLGIRQTLRL